MPSFDLSEMQGVHVWCDDVEPLKDHQGLAAAVAGKRGLDDASIREVRGMFRLTPKELDSMPVRSVFCRVPSFVQLLHDLVPSSDGEPDQPVQPEGQPPATTGDSSATTTVEQASASNRRKPNKK